MNFSFKILLALAFMVTTAQAGYIDDGISLVVNAAETARHLVAPVTQVAIEPTEALINIIQNEDGSFTIAAKDMVTVQHALKLRAKFIQDHYVSDSDYQCMHNDIKDEFVFINGSYTEAKESLNACNKHLSQAFDNVTGIPALAQSIALISGDLTGLNPVEVAATKAGVKTWFFVIIIPFAISFLYTFATTKGSFLIAIVAAQSVAMIVMIGFWSCVISKTEEKMNLLSIMTADNPYVAHFTLWLPAILTMIAKLMGHNFLGSVGTALSGSCSSASVLSACFSIAGEFGVSLSGIILTGLLILVARMWSTQLFCKTKEELAELVHKDFLRRIILTVRQGLPKQIEPKAEFMTAEERQRRMDAI